MKSTLKNLLKKVRMWMLLTFVHELKAIGTGTYIGRRCFFSRRACTIGAHSFVGDYCRLAVPDLVLGNYVMLAASVAIVGGDHRYDVVGIPSIQAGTAKPERVTISDDVWIGHAAVILEGVTIGEGAIVAAGSIVTHDIAPYSVVAGVPARFIKHRFDLESVELHRRALENLRMHMR